jgi:hypothetical protein
VRSPSGPSSASCSLTETPGSAYPTVPCAPQPRARCSTLPAAASCPLQPRARCSPVPAAAPCPLQHPARCSLVPAAAPCPLQPRALWPTSSTARCGCGACETECATTEGRMTAWPKGQPCRRDNRVEGRKCHPRRTMPSTPNGGGYVRGCAGRGAGWTGPCRSRSCRSARAACARRPALCVRARVCPSVHVHCMHTHDYTHARTLAHARARTHAHARAHMLARTHIHTLTHTRAHRRVHTHAHARTAHTHARTHTQTHTRTHARLGGTGTGFRGLGLCIRPPPICA